jgi:hypothetical protein
MDRNAKSFSSFNESDDTQLGTETMQGTIPAFTPDVYDNLPYLFQQVCDLSKSNEEADMMVIAAIAPKTIISASSLLLLKSHTC